MISTFYLHAVSYLFTFWRHYECSHLISLVNACPLTERQWLDRDDQCQKRERYHCIFVNRSHLGEVCMYEKGLNSRYGCPYVDVTDDPELTKALQFFTCEAVSGCPSKTETEFWWSTDLYQFPACLLGDLQVTSSESSTFTQLSTSFKTQTFGSKLVDASSSVFSNSTQVGSDFEVTERSVIQSSDNVQELKILQCGLNRYHIIIGGIILLTLIFANVVCWTVCFRWNRKASNQKFNSQNQKVEKPANSGNVTDIYVEIEDFGSRHSDSIVSYLEPTSNPNKQTMRNSADIDKHSDNGTMEGADDDEADDETQIEEDVHSYHQLDLFKAINERDKSDEAYQKISTDLLPAPEKTVTSGTE